MAQDLRDKKIAFCVALADFSERALALRNACDEFQQYHVDNLFAAGAANAITQDDIDGSTVKHLTPQIVDDAVAAIRALSTLTTTHRGNLRKAGGKPLPRAVTPAV